MKKSNQDKNNCSFCKKSGFPVLPVRYAVARSDIDTGKAPELPNDLKTGMLSEIDLPSGQHYTLRLMREGFLYLFNVVRGRWQGYYITEDGFLSLYIDVMHKELLALDPDSPSDLDAEINSPVDKDFPCRANADHIYPGRCITIPAASEAGDIYMTFSDDRWTKRVWKEYATNANNRRDSMRKLSLQEWKNGSGDFIRPLDNIKGVLAEANIPWRNIPKKIQKKLSITNAISYSHIPVEGIEGDVNGLIDWANKQAKDYNLNPAFFVLDDPAGVTGDIASLLEVREQEFNSREEINRPFVTAGIINSIRDGIKSRARTQAAKNYIDEKEEEKYYPFQPKGVQADEKDWFIKRKERDPEFKKEVEEFRRNCTLGIEESYLVDAENSAWGRYSSKLRGKNINDPDSQGQPDDWMRETYNKEISKYDADIMSPLATIYCKWLSSEELLEYFDTRFDNNNISSGVTFSTVLSHVVQGTQTYISIYKKYVDWLSSSDISNDNLLLRALYLNHKKLQIKALSAIKDSESKNEVSSIDSFAKLNWGSVIGSYYGYLSSSNITDELASPAWLLGRFIGPILGSLKGDILPRPLLVGLGMTAGRPVRIIEMKNSTLKEVIPELESLFKKIYPQLGEVDQLKFRRKLELETRALRKMENGFAGKHDFKFSIRHIELAELSAFKSDTRFMNEALKALEDVSESTSRARLSEKLATMLANRDVSGGILNTVLAIYSFNSELQGINNFAKVKLDKELKISALGVAATGAGTELIGGLLKVAQKAFVSASSLLNGAKNFALRWGARFSLYGGIALGLMDVWKGGEEFKSGNILLGTLYGFSGVGTAVVSYLIFSATVASASAAGVGIFGLSALFLWVAAGVVGIIVIIVGIAIWYFTENDLQEWIAECAFGDRGKLGLGTAQLQIELKKLDEISNKG